MPVDPALFASLRAAAERRGYWHPASRTGRGAAYDLFVAGVRAPATSSNLFDDLVLVAYTDDLGAPRVERFAATTDPGRAALDHPQHPGGTATVVPGQVRRCWAPGLHRGRYRALVHQRGVVIPVWRGSDRATVHLDAAGINLHHASGAARVDWYSAGCQVVQRPSSLARILELVDIQAVRGHGSTVSYTLFGPGEVGGM